MMSVLFLVRSGVTRRGLPCGRVIDPPTLSPYHEKSHERSDPSGVVWWGACFPPVPRHWGLTNWNSSGVHARHTWTKEDDDSDSQHAHHTSAAENSGGSATITLRLSQLSHPHERLTTEATPLGSCGGEECIPPVPRHWGLTNWNSSGVHIRHTWTKENDDSDSQPSTPSQSSRQPAHHAVENPGRVPSFITPG